MCPVRMAKFSKTTPHLHTHYTMEGEDCLLNAKFQLNLYLYANQRACTFLCSVLLHSFTHQGIAQYNRSLLLLTPEQFSEALLTM